MNRFPVICLMGPTAIGKTDLAIDLYQEGLPIDIISVDSAMVYKGLNIGSGKPSKDLLDKIPHSLIDIRNPEDIYTVADFCQDVINLINKSHSNNRVPLLVGGTMMYFNALQNGLAKLPNSDIDIRESLYREIELNSLQSLYQQLEKIDSISARKINPNDSQRIIRALEVYRITGETLSELLSADYNSNLFGNYQSINIILAPEDYLKSINTRKNLHENISKRFERMIIDGFIEEVEVLYNNPKIHRELPAIKSCGYRQAWQYLSGEINKETMIEKSIIVTRQLAKRQLTWLRSCNKNWPNTFWFNIYKNNVKAEIIRVLNF